MKQVCKLAKVSGSPLKQQWRPFTQSIQLLKEQQHQQSSSGSSTMGATSSSSSTGMKSGDQGSKSSSSQGNINIDRTSDTSSSQQQQQQHQASSQGTEGNMMTSSSSGNKGIQKRGKRDADSGWMMSPFDNVFRSFDKRFRDLENAFFGKSGGRHAARRDRDDYFGISPTRPFYGGYDFDNDRDLYGVLAPFSGSDLGFGGAGSMNTLAMDVIEHPKSYELVADLPGFDKNIIKVEYHEKQGTLSIQAEESYEKSSKDEQGEDKPRYHSMERMRSSYYRSFTLPENVSAEGIKADYKDGVLRITLPKGEAAKAKSIQIGAESGSTAGTSGSASNKQ